MRHAAGAGDGIVVAHVADGEDVANDAVAVAVERRRCSSGCSPCTIWPSSLGALVSVEAHVVGLVVAVEGVRMSSSPVELLEGWRLKQTSGLSLLETVLVPEEAAESLLALSELLPQPASTPTLAKLRAPRPQTSRNLRRDISMGFSLSPWFAPRCANL